MKEKELYPMYGIVTTVLTPFEESSLKIDVPSFRRYIRAALEGGVAGYLVPCNASEMATLSWTERKLLLEETVKIAHGKALVIPSVSSNGTDMDLAVQCKEYLELGADGININIPYTTNDEYKAVVEKIDALHRAFICLQDASRKDNGLPDELIVQCFNEFESVRCAKIEVKDSGPKYSRLLKATNGKLNISGARESDQMIEGYDRGMHALMPTGLFEIFSNIYKLYHEKSRESAMKLFFAALPIIVWTRQEGNLNRYFHKLYMQRIGAFESTAMRMPAACDKHHVAYANELIDYALDLRDRIPEFWK